MGFWDICKMILFGVIEGITEWLPVSNTGHLAVAGHYLGFSLYRESAVFREVFVAGSTLGASIAAALLFLPGNMLSVRRVEGDRVISRGRVVFWGIAVTAFLPTLLIGLLFAEEFSAFCFAPDSLRNLKLTVVTMIAGALLMIFGEFRNRRNAWLFEQTDEIPYRMLLLIGITQIVCFVPGSSRFGVMLLTAIALGVQRKAAVSTAVFLSIPALIISSAVTILGRGGLLSGIEISAVMTVAITAFFTSYFLLREIVKRLSRRELFRCAKYRIAFGVILLAFSIL